MSDAIMRLLFPPSDNSLTFSTLDILFRAVISFVIQHILPGDRLATLLASQLSFRALFVIMIPFIIQSDFLPA